MSKIQIKIPEIFEPLFTPKRYKVLYGGRGGGKSENICRFLLVMAMQRKVRVLCARELQSSIQDSVHKLFSDIISDHDLKFFTVLQNTIRGANGSEFLFKGLKHNVTEIKSMANIDYCFVEEAERVSDNSWEVLIPTIRKEGSEIIISFNPKHPTDPTYIRFVSNKDDDMWVQKVSWKDNPFLPTVLNQERERLLAQDPEAYSHVWDGEFDKRNYGGIWSSYVERARDEGRICPVPYQDGCRVITAWDLGNANSTAIWFAQVVGKEPRILDFYENSFQDLAHYVEVIKNKPYAYECHYLPHDADHQRLGMPSTIAGQIENMGLKVQPIKIASIENRIEAGRDLLKRAWIDQSRCRDGILALTNYQYEWDDNRNRFKDKPEKNEFTDACDAFGYLAQSLRDMGDKIEITGSPTDHYNTPSQSSWMN